MKGRKVQLVLGSGGARGLAHIGVIDELEERGHEIISTVGCSMGAVVGGIHAAGHHAAYREMMTGLTKARVYGMFDFTLDKQGFMKGDRIFKVIRSLVDVRDIRDLRIPFTAVAAEMEHRQEKWFRSGDFFKALRASIAIPGVFTPVREGGHVYVDGGVLNPLPLNAVERQADAITVAVNLNGKRKGEPKAADKTSEDSRLYREISRWLKLDAGTETNGDKMRPDARSLTDLLIFSYHMTQDRLTELMTEKYPPDIMIDIPRDACSTFDFHRGRELIALGRSACSRALDAFDAAAGQ